MNILYINACVRKFSRTNELAINRQNKLKSPTMKLKNFNFVSC